MPKRILILSHSYGIPFIESCNQYTRLFESDGHDVTVAYLSGKTDEQIIQKTLAKKVIFLNCSSLRGLKLGAISKVLKLCRQNNFDIVICQRYKPSYIMLWVNHFCRIPTVICIMHAMGTMQSFWRRVLVTSLMKKNMIMAGVSDAVREDLRNSLSGLPPERIVTLHNIIDHELFEPQLYSRAKAREKLNLPEDAFVFGNIGRLAAEKNQKSLLQAFAEVVSNYSNAKLVIMGNGPFEQALKQQTYELKIENNVLFMGFVADAFRYMKAFDVFVLCSIKESFGRVLLEAMVARVPIIATKTDGIPDVMGETGFLVESENHLELTKKMLEVFVLSVSQREAIAEKSHQRMCDHFSLEPFKKNFEQVLSKQM